MTHDRRSAARPAAVQVQRSLGYHSPAFTLATHVQLLEDDRGSTLVVELPAAGENKVGTQPTGTDRTQPNVELVEAAA